MRFLGDTPSDRWPESRWVTEKPDLYPHIDSTQPEPPSDSKPEKDHKRRWDLLPLPLLAGLADVFGHGADKGYAPFSWQHCPADRVLPKYGASAMRHLEAIQRGEETDPDSGLLHAYHLMACALIIAWHQNEEE